MHTLSPNADLASPHFVIPKDASATQPPTTHAQPPSENPSFAPTLDTQTQDLHNPALINPVIKGSAVGLHSPIPDEMRDKTNISTDSTLPGQKAQSSTDTYASEHSAQPLEATNPVVLPGLSDTRIPISLASNPIVAESAAIFNMVNSSIKVSAATIPTLDPHQDINGSSSSSDIHPETQYGNTSTIVVPGYPKVSAGSTQICIQVPTDSNISTVDFSVIQSQTHSQAEDINSVSISNYDSPPPDPIVVVSIEHLSALHDKAQTEDHSNDADLHNLASSSVSAPTNSCEEHATDSTSLPDNISPKA